MLYRETGIAALALLALVLLVFQFLLRELLLSQRRAEQLAALQLGVLASMVETLALRDRMTARHSAAVARYARALAEAHGCARERAGPRPHRRPAARHRQVRLPGRDPARPTRRSTDEDWEIVRRHPEDGARVVARIDGYAPVADIILCHHERWDGKGYPRGSPGEAIPLLARVITIADAYDVMTARDSYRTPLTSPRRSRSCAASPARQLDPELVETFVALLERKGLRFRHGDDADFEAELDFERRVREYARPRRASSPSA